MMDGFGMPGGFGFCFGGLFMILWWVIILALVRWMSKSSGSDRSASSTSKSAMDILKERYARGEIDAQEYQKIKRELME